MWLAYESGGRKGFGVPGVVALPSRQQSTGVIKCEGCEEQTAINLHIITVCRGQRGRCVSVLVCEREPVPGLVSVV